MYNMAARRLIMAFDGNGELRNDDARPCGATAL
jgi:hypothetical protein